MTTQAPLAHLQRGPLLPLWAVRQIVVMMVARDDGDGTRRNEKCQYPYPVPSKALAFKEGAGPRRGSSFRHDRRRDQGRRDGGGQCSVAQNHTRTFQRRRLRLPWY